MRAYWLHILTRHATSCLAGLLALTGTVTTAETVRIKIEPRFDGSPLVFDSITYGTAAGQRISVTRLDFLISQLALRGSNGHWIEASNRFAYVNGREGRTASEWAGFPPGSYDRLRFHIGLPAHDNHSDPGGRMAEDPLNPTVNGLHWNWQGGYVFLALEGLWRGNVTGSVASTSGYSYHLATDPLLMTIELPLTLGLQGTHEFILALHLERVFAATLLHPITEDSATTHSRPNDPLALQLRTQVEQAFTMERSGLSAAPPAIASTARATNGLRLVAPQATPYRFAFSRIFPRPALPLDNPLTEEGVALGKRLFHDVRLSSGNQQSCASCHAARVAFVDPGQRFSLGASGQTGSRNAMSLVNLAWKDSFFWDGRARTLRDQVLEPIENPVEMHESLSNVVSKLKGTPDDEAAFAAAFGSREINPDRIARALEQFLLVQVSHRSKFDRVLAGELELSAEEKRGSALFHTEYDPRRGLLGADCFHCHGGPNFRSQTFANNGLDRTPGDPGRFSVTGKAGDEGKFSVPSLRNVAVTAPYMHDGRFASLEEAVAHYATGVQRHPTLDPNLAKHPNGGVPLTEADQGALVAFLKTLTDARWEAVFAGGME